VTRSDRLTLTSPLAVRSASDRDSVAKYLITVVTLILEALWLCLYPAVLSRIAFSTYSSSRTPANSLAYIQIGFWGELSKGAQTDWISDKKNINCGGWTHHRVIKNWLRDGQSSATADASDIASRTGVRIWNLKIREQEH